MPCTREQFSQSTLGSSSHWRLRTVHYANTQQLYGSPHPVSDSLMSASSSDGEAATVSLSPTEQWTLHHLLLHQLEQAATESGDTEEMSEVLLDAFETIDRGEQQFTHAELQAVQSVLAQYHHSTSWWELERSQIERVLHQVAEALPD